MEVYEPAFDDGFPTPVSWIRRSQELYTKCHKRQAA
jgi:hypothetical protein